VCLCFDSMIGSLLVRRVAHARGGRVRRLLRRLARLGRLAGGLGGAPPGGAVDQQGVRFFCLACPCCRAAWERSGSMGSEVAGRSFGSGGLGYISRSKKNFYDFFAMCRLSCVRRLLFSSAYRNPRRSLAGDSLAVRSCFSVTQLAAPSIPRIVRDRWRGDRGIAQGVSFSQMAAPFVPRIVRDKWRGDRGIAGLFLSLSAS
jgi:hypothetical protein